MTAITNVTRRGFLGGSAAAMGGLVLGVKLPLGGRAAQAAADEAGTLNAFLAVAPDGRVTFQNPFCEMGQGTWTSIPTIIAAGTLNGIEIYQSGDLQLAADAFVAAGLSFIFALIAIALMMAWLRRASFTPFVVYRIALGVFLLVVAYGVI